MGFSKIGQIVFNQAASMVFQKETVEHVLLLWDADEHKIAIKTTSNKKDPRAYRLKFLTQGNGSGFSAKTFLDHIGVDLSERKTIPIEINRNSEMLVEVEIPESFFVKKTPQLKLRPVKTG
jgi:hypothetical protein